MTRGVGGHGPANIMEHLGGINFPASKADIIDHARNGGGPDTNQVVDTLRGIEDRTYNSPADVMHAVGQEE